MTKSKIRSVITLPLQMKTEYKRSVNIPLLEITVKAVLYNFYVCLYLLIKSRLLNNAKIHGLVLKLHSIFFVEYLDDEKEIDEGASCSTQPWTRSKAKGQKVGSPEKRGIGSTY